ncbi:hypothetical protein MO973_21025 [Paenibacillus sp. TRM 82003]|nr:hypothetical protein [Paenibacillus sp. TRM 82003]
MEEWFADEKEGYADLGSKNKHTYTYGYHALNARYGFQYLDQSKSGLSALGFGSAYGDELNPLIDKLLSISIVDPSDGF